MVQPHPFACVYTVFPIPVAGDENAEGQPLPEKFCNS